MATTIEPQTIEENIKDIKSIFQRLEPALVRTGADITELIIGRATLDTSLHKLESDVAKMAGGVDRLIVDVAELKGRISQLPSTIVMIGFVLAVLGAAGFLRYFGPR